MMTSKEVDNTILSVTFITVIGIVIAQFITGAFLYFAPQIYDRTSYQVLMVLCPAICLLTIYRRWIWNWISKL